MGSAALLAGAVAATASLIAAPISSLWSRRLLRWSAVGVWGAVLVVGAAFVRGDTSLVLVVDHTRPGLGVVGRVMGIWAGSAGSLLLFTAVIATVLAIVPVTEPDAPNRSDRLAVLPSAVVVAALSWTSLLLASPFERLENPAIAGSGMSPILEHWAMIVHPPLLYLGLALSLVPAIAPEPLRRAGAVGALVILTAALALGGGWAYVELGWGGWWAWDPIENAALIPWLLMVVFLHVPARHAAARWSGVLAWPAVLAGTAMTRTSQRTSVHAFADASSLRWVLWPLALAGLAGAVVVGVWGGRPTRRDGLPWRRLLPVALVLYTAAVVALGTFRPFVPGDVTGGVFYSRMLFPTAIVGLVGAGVAPRRRIRAERLVAEVLVGSALGLLLSFAVGWSAWYQLVLSAALGVAAVTVLAGLDSRRRVARTIAHLGLVLVLGGTLGASASSTSTIGLALGETTRIDGHRITNRGATLASEDPLVITADLLLDGEHHLLPELAVHPERRLRLPEVATFSRPWEDVQLILRSADDDGSVLVTVNVQPLTQLVWYGAVLLAGGVAAVYLERLSRRARRSSSTVAVDAGVGAGDSADSPSVG